MTYTKLGQQAIFHNFLTEQKESVQEQELLRIRGLWRAAIMQSIVDAASKSKKRIAKKNKIDAIEWLKGTTLDFSLVCSLADMDPHYVKEKTATALSQGCQWRKSSAAQHTMHEIS